jgi:hypothetical protein
MPNRPQVKMPFKKSFSGPEKNPYMDLNVYQLREAGGYGACWDGNVTVLPTYVAESP